VIAEQLPRTCPVERVSWCGVGRAAGSRVYVSSCRCTATEHASSHAVCKYV